MIRLLCLLTLAHGLAACGTPDCEAGTMVVELTPDAAAATADHLRVRTTIGSNTLTTETAYTGQVEVGVPFPMTAYSAGLHVDVLVEARAGNAVVASASISQFVLPRTCVKVPLTLSDAGTTFTVSGMVSGVEGTGLVLTNAGGDDLPVAASGAFTFATPVASGQAYAVAVKTQPSAPEQVCMVVNGAGTIDDTSITNVEVQCATKTHTVGGTVTGLAGTGLTLELDGSQDLQISQAAQTYTFLTAIPSGTKYSITVRTQPTGPAQTCMVSHGMDTIGTADITDANVTCN